MKTANETINQFIIETTLVDPIQKIVNQLKGGSFRDCDIKWLDNKMEGFIKFAAETLGMSLPTQVERETFLMFNAHVKIYYTEKFIALLNYFKSF